MGDFSESLCGCFSDPETCFIVWCCPCGQFGRNAEEVHEGSGPLFALAWWLASCMGLGWLVQFYMRTEIRKKYGMESHVVQDLLVSFCCMYCALCQESREIKRNG
eukprot:TRINITY_DN26133_c0_g1_i1.p1 TRINITY_DN26133_c0_g1~~TRINITY_DN26133_c0_g1_i1.p1  ORF type:complete len:105 (-),score=8.90 TRINITY_DN26133_c0_g1_i1:19-333(-)